MKREIRRLGCVAALGILALVTGAVAQGAVKSSPLPLADFCSHVSVRSPMSSEEEFFSFVFARAIGAPLPKFNSREPSGTFILIR